MTITRNTTIFELIRHIEQTGKGIAVNFGDVHVVNVAIAVGLGDGAKSLMDWAKKERLNTTEMGND